MSEVQIAVVALGVGLAVFGWMVRNKNARKIIGKTLTTKLSGETHVTLDK